MPEIRPLTTIMLEPALKLLLATEGAEPPRVPFDAGWRAVRELARIPAAHADDGTSFQSELIAEEGGIPVFSVMFVRQVADPAPDGAHHARLVALQYLFPPPPAGSGITTEPQALWTADHDDWAHFANAVEATDAFRYAMATAAEHVAVFTEEDAGGEA